MILPYASRIDRFADIEALPDVTCSKSEVVAWWIIEGAGELAGRMALAYDSLAEDALDRRDDAMASQHKARARVLEASLEILTAPPARATSDKLIEVGIVLRQWQAVGPLIALWEEEHAGRRR